jgi:hypothetical protein
LFESGRFHGAIEKGAGAGFDPGFRRPARTQVRPCQVLGELGSRAGLCDAGEPLAQLCHALGVRQRAPDSRHCGVVGLPPEIERPHDVFARATAARFFQQSFEGGEGVRVQQGAQQLVVRAIAGIAGIYRQFAHKVGLALPKRFYDQAGAFLILSPERAEERACKRKADRRPPERLQRKCEPALEFARDRLREPAQGEAETDRQLDFELSRVKVTQDAALSELHGTLERFPGVGSGSAATAGGQIEQNGAILGSPEHLGFERRQRR